MPTNDWQTLIALLCVLFAAGVIVRRVWKYLHPAEGSCGGGCAGCGSARSESGGSASHGEMVTLSLALPPQSKPSQK